MDLIRKETITRHWIVCSECQTDIRTVESFSLDQGVFGPVYCPQCGLGHVGYIKGDSVAVEPCVGVTDDGIQTARLEQTLVMLRCVDNPDFILIFISASTVPEGEMRELKYKEMYEKMPPSIYLSAFAIIYQSNIHPVGLFEFVKSVPFRDIDGTMEPDEFLLKHFNYRL